MQNWVSTITFPPCQPSASPILNFEFWIFHFNLDFKQDILPLKNLIFRTALRITLNREEAEDIVQDCLIKIWKQLQDGVTIQNLESYALTMSRNLALDRKSLARNNVISLVEEVHDHEDEHQLAPDEQLIKSESTSRIEQIVNNLPEKQRTIMQLRDIEGKSYKEIADILNISESDVKVTLFRARKQVKDTYLKMGIFD